MDIWTFNVCVCESVCPFESYEKCEIMIIKCQYSGYVISPWVTQTNVILASITYSSILHHQRAVKHSNRVIVLPDNWCFAVWKNRMPIRHYFRQRVNSVCLLWNEERCDIRIQSPRYKTPLLSLLEVFLGQIQAHWWRKEGVSSICSKDVSPLSHVLVVVFCSQFCNDR